MAKNAEEYSQYLRRSLYLYDLPRDLLESLSLLSSQENIPISSAADIDDDEPSQRTLNEEGISTSTACALCKASFSTVADQRQHVRSDFHGYNLKLSLKGLPAISEATFIKQIGDLDESISGSDSSESESDSDEDGGVALNSLLKKNAKLEDGEDGQANVLRRPQAPGNAPMFWLTSPKLPEDVGLGIYRATLTGNEQSAVSTGIVDVLRKKQLKAITTKHSGNAQKLTLGPADPHVFLCMIGGGHFAAAVIALAPEIRKGAGGIEEHHPVVLAHKTFHRYTTRRKQGGSQSANDNAKGNAHSVGSSIRRANEAALIQDVRNVLHEWKEMIDTAELVFVRATGSQNRRTIFGPYDGQILSLKDERIRGFPFSTKRATQAELLRAFQELTRLKRTQLAAQEEKASAPAQPKTQPKTKPAAPKPSPEEEEALLHASQIQNFVRRSKAPALLLYFTKNNISPNYRFANHHAPTALHLAASSSAPAIVSALLLKANADPTVTNDDGKTPYEIAGDAKTHDAFRTARYTLGDAAWDWAKAKVGSALSADEAVAKSKREQEASASAESDRRKADLERLAKEEEDRKVGKIEKKAGSGKILSAVPDKTWTDKNEEELRGLTPEMRQRLERERRARAAEARMKALQGK